MKTIILSCAILLGPTVVALHAQEPKDLAKQWQAYFQGVAKSYSIVPDKADESYVVTPKSVHDFLQQGGGSYMRGTFFVWTQEGRATAITSFWSSGAGNGQAMVAHEMHSLALEPFTARQKGKNKDFWRPRKPGLTLMPLDGVSAPKKTRGLRLAQMRSAARSFDGFVHRSKTTDPLRLQTEPLFRYSESKKRKTVVDGAVFAFFSSWDPEVLLVIEAHKKKDGELVWQYSGARMCNVGLSLKRKGREVWAVKEVPTSGSNFNTPRDTYYARHWVDSVDPKSLE